MVSYRVHIKFLKLPLRAHHPLCFPCLYRSSWRAKVVVTANDKWELKYKVCETADAPSSLRLDKWKHLGFPGTRNERGEKVTDRRKTTFWFCQNITNTHLRHILKHSKFGCCLINGKCTFSQVFICLFYRSKYRAVDVLQRHYCTVKFWYCYIFRQHFLYQVSMSNLNSFLFLWQCFLSDVSAFVCFPLPSYGAHSLSGSLLYVISHFLCLRMFFLSVCGVPPGAPVSPHNQKHAS